MGGIYDDLLVIAINVVPVVLAFIAAYCAACCMIWTRHDPLFFHPLFRVSFISGFLGFGINGFLTVHGDHLAIVHMLNILGCFCFILCGYFHQREATKEIVSKSIPVSRTQFAITESVLWLFLAVVVISLLTNALKLSEILYV